MRFENTEAFARKMDAEDPLGRYREAFLFPRHNGKEIIYFTGNSLGLQPRKAAGKVREVLTDWEELAVEGHFRAKNPWWEYHEQLAPYLEKIVGAKPGEVTVMNTLTVNLHLLMVSFYRPQGKRIKILCEEKAFPSDQYMLQSQLRFHGYDPAETLVEVRKRPGEHHWRTEDILAAIEEHSDSLALVLMGGVNYYNGQVLDMEAITRAGQAAGAIVGWDLAHAAGNVWLDLHGWGVDFAAWCSYKYMNSGPGNASGVFIHQRHLDRRDIRRFEGWWGTRKETRFLMQPEFDPMPTADAWQLSNPPILALAPYLASLELFDEVGMEALIAKRDLLTGYLEFILREVDKEVDSRFEIITPADRGCQLSVFLHGEGRPLFDYLMDHGVLPDWREPNVIRLAPAPFYCSFLDMYRFGQILKEGIQKGSAAGAPASS
ncbi:MULTISPECIES: kynureninase [unclassified Robiginitalea]|uniref:kynureninase n=1 Tax=Robiginitalea TaxID=252306 RepID=UPI00234993E9|nr:MULTISPECIES: kynureninase [unclassified Robiginitalea]MDC6354653.1 kynureninase [Robiginitalea sp. PM2]MDC6374665.1 kynureninase [Robiginitalea sp. SP8]